MRILSVGTAACPPTILPSKASLMLRRRYSSDSQPKSLVNLVTLLPLPESPVVNLAALCWTCLSDVISFRKWGSQTAQAYSSTKRTRAIYACSRNSLGQCLRLRHRKPTLEFALAVMLAIYGDQDKLLDLLTPRYFALFTTWRGTPLSWYTEILLMGWDERQILMISHLLALNLMPHLYVAPLFQCLEFLLG